MDSDKLLKKIFDEFVEEVRANPDLNSRIERLLEAHTREEVKSSGQPHRRKPGPFDPMIVYREGLDALRLRLEELDIEQLKDIVAEQGMDRSRLALKWRTKDRLVNLIVTSVESRVHKGDAFRAPPVGRDGGISAP